MSKVNRVKVVIDDTMYELTSQESHEYIQAVSTYIDRKIKSIYSIKSEASINPRLKTLFVSLNIADDLFKEKENAKELEMQLRLSQERLQRAEEQIAALNEQSTNLASANDVLTKDLEKLRLELDEYMEAFETEESIRKEQKVTKLNR